MKLTNLLKNLTILSILVIGFCVASDLGASSLDGETLTWLSIWPPVIAIILALATHEAHLALFIGIWVGASMITGNLFTGLTTS